MRPKVLENLQADSVVAKVGPMPQREVGLYRVQPLVLKVVRPDLLDQADTPSFLGKIDESPGPLPADHSQRHVKLVAAITAEGVEQVAGEARRVEPDQWGFDRLQVPHHEGDRLVARFVLDAIGDDPSLAVAGRQVGLGGAMDQLLSRAAVLDQGLDGDDGQIRALGRWHGTFRVWPCECRR